MQIIITVCMQAYIVHVMYIHTYAYVHIITLARLSCICMFEAMKMGGSAKEPGSKEYVCK